MKLLFLLLPLFAMTVYAQTPEKVRDQARSMVISQFGIVATSQTLASEAGAQVLEAFEERLDIAVVLLEKGESVHALQGSRLRRRADASAGEDRPGGRRSS